MKATTSAVRILLFPSFPASDRTLSRLFSNLIVARISPIAFLLERKSRQSLSYSARFPPRDIRLTPHFCSMPQVSPMIQLAQAFRRRADLPAVAKRWISCYNPINIDRHLACYADRHTQSLGLH